MKTSILKRINKIEKQRTIKNDAIIVIEGEEPESQSNQRGYRPSHLMCGGKIIVGALLPKKICVGKRVILRYLPGVKPSEDIWSETKELYIEPASPEECEAWHKAYGEYCRFADIILRVFPPSSSTNWGKKLKPPSVSGEDKKFLCTYVNTNKSFDEYIKELRERMA